MTAVGLGRVKTLARYDRVELRSHWPTFGRLARGSRHGSRWLRVPENSQTLRFMHFRCLAHLPQSIIPCTHRRRVPVASWKKILAIFDPHTFSHSQGQDLPVWQQPAHGRSTPTADVPDNAAIRRVRATCGLMRRSKKSRTSNGSMLYDSHQSSALLQIARPEGVPGSTGAVLWRCPVA